MSCSLKGLLLTATMSIQPTEEAQQMCLSSHRMGLCLEVPISWLMAGTASPFCNADPFLHTYLARHCRYTGNVSHPAFLTLQYVMDCRLLSCPWQGACHRSALDTASVTMLMSAACFPCRCIEALCLHVHPYPNIILESSCIKVLRDSWLCG